MPEENALAMAIRHVAEARRIVGEQKRRIERLKADGHPVLDHEQTLTVFEATLKILEDHERMLRIEAQKKRSPQSN